MCIIIQKPAGKTIPVPHLRQAVQNNPHGFGVMVSSNGRLQVHRSTQTANVETLHRIINNEYQDNEVMLHLRWITKGDRVIRNQHPFPVLEYEEDGVDLRMMHNGTIFGYGGKITGKGKEWNESDTRGFVRTLVRPLFKRLIKAHGWDMEELLKDTFCQQLLEKELGKSSKSVLAFMDGEGRSFYVNKAGNGGVIWDGVYYSNTYSLDPEHREPTNNSYKKRDKDGVLDVSYVEPYDIYEWYDYDINDFDNMVKEQPKNAAQTMKLMRDIAVYCVENGLSLQDKANIRKAIIGGYLV